jgi:hypothetical protein
MLLGVDDASWHIRHGLDSLLLQTILPSFSRDVLSSAAVRAIRDTAGANGLARWIFGEEKEPSLSKKALARVLPVIARSGLSHPRQNSRCRTLTALARLGARKPLRLVLKGKIPVREEEQPAGVDLPGLVIVGPRDSELCGKVSDAAFAAHLLAGLGDRQSLSQIRRLSIRAKEPDKALLKAALKQIAEK